VWKFGNEPGLDRLINSPESEDAAQLLPLQYHINKTYVAVSRTKSKLYILDDDTGINNLWRVTQNSDLIKSYLSKINEKKEQWNSSHLETYKEGSRLDFSDNVIDNQEETAKQLMEKGLSSKQPYLLGQAARIFAKLNDSQNSAKCKGYVEIFDEKNYFLAGEYFCEGGWTKLAVQAFLLANNLPNDKAGLNKIIEVSASDLTLKDTVSYYVALAFCRTTIESVDALIDLLLKDAPLQFDNYFPHEAMKQIISGILDNGLKQIVDRNQSSESLLEGAVTLYQKKSISIQTEIIALMAFSLSKYKLAVDYWDMSRKRDEEKYKNAQMQLKDFPDNITVLFSGKDYAKIASEYKKYEGKLSDDAMVIVIQALFFENKHEEAFDAVVNIHSAAQLEKITQACSSCFNSKEKEILSVCVRISDIFSESWNKVLRLIDSAKNGDINPFYVAIALARTNGLPSVLPTTQKLISDFLEREFIRKFENIPESLVFDIGTAIEKAGKRNDDALKYYKLAAKRFSGNREKERVCAERWIHAKEMWVQRHKGLDAINHKEDVAEIEEACARYGINKEKINDFIALDGKSSVMRYIIDTESKKVSIKIPRENKKPPITDDDHHVKQKVEVNIDGYELVYFTKIKRLNITSNADGKTISVCHSESKIGTILTQDYTVTDSFTDDIGACQKIEGTPVYFSVTEEKIMVSFEKTKVVVHFS
jgi:hypothetical protein